MEAIVIHDGTEIKSVSFNVENTKVIGTMYMFVGKFDMCVTIAEALNLANMQLLTDFISENQNNEFPQTEI